MKDFRERVVKHRPDRSEVTTLLRDGLLSKALRKARAAGIELSQEEIDAAARAMFHAGRAGELLSMISTVPIALPYDTTTLLVRAFEVGDYHTFLKQAYRLGAFKGHETRISEAIVMIARRAPREAADWRRKFGLVDSAPPRTS